VTKRHCYQQQSKYRGSTTRHACG